MAGYIIVDVRTRTILLICTVITITLFIIGILIGYFPGKESSKMESSKTVKDALKASCKDTIIKTPSGSLYFDRYLERHSEKQACVRRPEDCWNFGLPRHYNAYHLNGKSIEIDGKLDDDAWKEVPWSENFVDIRSEVYPKPYLNTKFKIRWDDDRLYVGAYIQETDIWATLTSQDDMIFRENAFEFLIDVDGTMFNYKQIQINALGTMLDQLNYPGIQEKEKEWHPDARKGVFIEGTLNTPGDKDEFWSVELSLSFINLAQKSPRDQFSPRDGEVWFMQFARSEQKLNVSDGTYRKVTGSVTDWWSWQPSDAINLHLQDRWGLVQFKKSVHDKKFRFDKWHIYKALFDTKDALEKYKAINGRYTTAIEELDVPPYLLARTCVEIPEIERVKRRINSEAVDDFDVVIKSMLLSHKPAHIRSDKYVNFGD